MLSKKELNEIKEHLNKSQNPLFLFDDDQDGLCSFLILQRGFDKGKGFPIKSPELNKDYFRKFDELNCDYIFVLDKPKISKDFFEKVQQNNVPLVWIDHHDIDRKEIPNFVNYYNPLFSEEKTNEPVTHLCYNITNNDLWLEIIGCISDRYFPEKEYNLFKEKYPDLIIDSKNPSKIFYLSDIGKISLILGFGLKDKVTNVIRMMKFLKDIRGPHEILNEENKHAFKKRFEVLRKKYEKLIIEAKKQATESNLLFFKYGGETSMSAEVSNRLSFIYPEKIIVVLYESGGKVNISARGEGVKKIILRAIESLEGANGGGHENAVGARIKKEDIDIFKKRLEDLF